MSRESMWAIVEVRGRRNPEEVTLHGTVQRTRREAWDAAREQYTFVVGGAVAQQYLDLFEQQRRKKALRAVRVEVTW